MAASTFDVERRIQAAETQADVQTARLEIAGLTHRADRHEAALGHATIVAYAAFVVGALFGLVDFVLLIQVIGRLH